MEGYGGPVRLDRPDLGGIDPALDACCRREAESNRKRDALTSTLRRHDRVHRAEEERRRVRRHVVSGLSFGSGCRCCYDPNGDGGEYGALVEARRRRMEEGNEAAADRADEDDEAGAEGAGDDDDDENDDSDDDSEFDYLLDEDLPGGDGDGDGDGEGDLLREHEERRRAEFEAAAFRRETELAHGYGAHRQMHPGRVLRAAGLDMTATTTTRGGVPPAAVVHLYDPESTMSASLDLFLESEAMAGQYRGTKFLRGNGRAALLVDPDLAGRALPRIRPDADLPALIAVKNGDVVSFVPNLEGLGCQSDGTIEPRAVEEWLDRTGVLRRDPPRVEELCRIRPEEDALYETMGAASTGRDGRLGGGVRREEEFYDCGVEGCNKTFRHEHVGVKNEQQDGLLVREEDEAISS